MNKLVWSEYQKAIFKDIRDGEGDTLISAVAGASKTTVLVEACKYVQKGKKILMCAFNKSIQMELKDRVGSYVETVTLHSLGFRAIKQKFGNVQLDTFKTSKIVASIIGEDRDVNMEICRTISLCKAHLIDIPDKIEQLIDEFDIETFHLDRNEFIQIVIKTLAECKKNKQFIDYDDMVWFPFVYNLSIGKYDMIFVDECQDLSKNMIAMILGAKRIGGRIVFCGDKNQSIYKFRGADSESINNIINLTGAKTLPLSISYRCPKKVVELCQKYVPEMEYAPNAKDGEILDIKLSNIEKFVKPGCIILSRTNAPTIKLAMQFIKHGIRTNIKGRDIGNNLIFLIKKSNKKTVESFLDWLDKWYEKEVKRFAEKKFGTTALTDKYECLYNLCDGSKSIEDVKRNISDLFSDQDESNIVLFSTVHKFKGSQRQEVFILDYTFFTESNIEERNIRYVSLSRTMDKLFFVKKDVF
jgi:superfamily I DNA/RNA helicase